VRKPNPFLFLVVLIAVVLIAALAAGCGTATSAPRAAIAATATATTTATAAAAGQSSAATPKERAAADAKAILGQFVPPPGAVRLPKRPALPDGSPVMGLAATTQADVTGYWRVSGTATALLAWEKAHIARGFSRQDVIIGPPSWNTVYTLPAVPGVLPKREMNVQFYQEGGGQTVIMAEAMVSWQPPRPAAEVIPASVTEVTITPAGIWAGNPVPVTVTSAAAVRRLAALVNGLPRSTVGQGIPCPSGGPGFTLTFRAAPGGPPAAVAGGPAACDQVTLSLGGKSWPSLLPPDASAYRAAVLKIAGLHWKLG
jgi:hypothetical protein